MPIPFAIAGLTVLIALASPFIYFIVSALKDEARAH
jgi:hypothetical protein